MTVIPAYRTGSTLLRVWLVTPAWRGPGDDRRGSAARHARPQPSGTSTRATGEFPVLLTQTPYTGSLGAADLVSPTGPGEYFVTRGYIYISADVRGTGRSGGNGEFFGPRDALDGADLVKWILTEFGDDTVVGLHGCSYLGDWGHGGGLDEGIQLQWYDTWLKNMDTGLDTETDTPVHVQDRATSEWTNVSAYPFVSRATTYYLTPGGTLDRTAPIPPAAQPLAWGPAELAGTTLTYTTPALPSARVLAGPSAVHVEATTAATDVMLRAELSDVAPDGTATLVTWGSILGSLRSLDPERSWYAANDRLLRPFLSLTKETAVPANQRVGYDIPLDPTMWTVAKGHQLRLRLQTQPEQTLCEEKRLAITTSAVGCRPRAEVMSRLVGGHYVIGLGGAAPTFVNLPLVAPGPFSFFEGTAADGRPEPLPTEW